MLSVRSVAEEAFIGKDRPDFTIELHGCFRLDDAESENVSPGDGC